jgi:hypothetical protein
MSTAWTECLRRNLAAVRVTRVPATADVEWLGRLTHDGPRGDISDPARLADLSSLSARRR